MNANMNAKISDLLLLAALTCTASLSVAQTAGRTWVTFNDSAPGTPPSFVIDRAASNEDRSVFNISLNGYYFEPVVVPNEGTFIKLSLPSSEGAVLGEVGKAALPTLGMLLGIPTDAATVGTPIVTVLESTVVNNILVYPAQPEEIEQEDNFPLAPFTQDDDFYRSRVPYPSARSQVGRNPSELLGLKIQPVSIHPFRYVPSSREVTIFTRFRVEVPHDGLLLPAVPMTRRTREIVSSVVDNWTNIASNVGVNLVRFEGEYLIITPARYRNAIEPLAQQKRERGFRVVIRTTEAIGNSQSQIRQAIADFNRGPGTDQYVLLVGEHSDIPLGTDPEYNLPSDHTYACVDEGPYPDVYLGRLSVDSEADLTAQVAKILRYQDNPTTSPYYRNVELIAHREVAKGYIDNMTDVANQAGYIPQPTFTLRAGTVSTSTVANVISDINAGRHIVMYRGHGSSTAWTDWDFNSASFSTTNVQQVNNDPRPCIVIHVACTNAAIDTQNDSLAEKWMEQGPSGAVASYGATRETGTGRNHAFARRFHSLLFSGQDGPYLSIVCNVAWILALTDLGPNADVEENWYRYLLLGDPEMRIHTSTPSSIFVTGLPASLGLAPRQLSIVVRSATGAPIPNATVAVSKGDEVLDNLYSAADGSVRITVDPRTDGQLVVRAFTDLEPRIGARVVIPVVGCPADINEDGGVDADDVIAFFAFWDAPDPRADFNNDGGVDGDDIIAFFARWDRGC